MNNPPTDDLGPRRFVAHGLRIQSSFDMAEVAGCQLPDPGADGRFVPDLELRLIAREAMPQPSARQWTVRRSAGQSVAHGPWGAVFESSCGSRAWLSAGPAGAPVVLHIARAPGTPTDVFNHSVLHSFLPLALTNLGHMILHAACVVCGGRAFIFAGASCMGKSTLAAGFAARGLAVYADDVVRVAVGRQNGAHAWPSYPGARLRSNSFLLDAEQRRGSEASNGLPRFRVHTGRFAPAPSEGVPVAAVFFLGRSRRAAPQLERLTPIQALMPWVDASFLLSLPRPERSRETFTRVTNFVTRVPAWRLTYKRSSRHFDALLDQLQQAMQTMSQREPQNAQSFTLGTV